MLPSLTTCRRPLLRRYAQRLLVLTLLLCSAALAGAGLASAAPPRRAPESSAGSAAASASLVLLAVQQAELTAGDGAANDYFGYPVALDGDTALVGASDHDVGANADQGAAYVFVRSAGVWAQQGVALTAGGASDEFGCSVALSGETALVGARYHYVIGANADQGAAYVFTRSGTSWSQQVELTAADGAALDHFGRSVALSADTALVGANWHTVGANTYQGAAYVFVRSGTSWSQQAELTAGDGAAGDNLGDAVALDGDSAVVGAPGHAVGANTHEGAAYVFVRSGTSWSQQAELAASDGAADDEFGYSVALSGDTALVGAPFHKVGANVQQGAAYVFGPPPTITITAPNGGESWTRNASHSFTWTLDHAVSAGSFRVYLRNSGGTYYLQTTTNIPAVAGQTSYSFPKTISAAAGTGYVARVQYYDAGGTAATKDDSDASFSIVEPPLAVTVTAPNGGESWARLVSHSFTWTLNHAVSSGSFRVYLKNAGGTYYLQTTTNIPAVAGQTSYSFAKTISVAAGSYVARVQYYDAGGTAGAKDDSDAPFTIADALALTVTAPNGGESWARLVSHSFTWKLNMAVSSGSFRVYLRNAGGTYYLQTTTNIPAVAGQTSYSFPKVISVAAASGYVARVQYYDGGGTAGAKDDSNATFTITP